MDSMIRGRNSEGKSRFVLVDDDGRLVVADSGTSFDGGRLKIVSGDITATELNNDEYEFTEDIDGVAIKNDGTNNITVTINTLTFTIRPQESRILETAPFNTVTFSSGAVFRMNALKMMKESKQQ